MSSPLRVSVCLAADLSIDTDELNELRLRPVTLSELGKDPDELAVLDRALFQDTDSFLNVYKALDMPTLVVVRSSQEETELMESLTPDDDLCRADVLSTQLSRRLYP